MKSFYLFVMQVAIELGHLSINWATENGNQQHLFSKKLDVAHRKCNTSIGNYQLFISARSTLNTSIKDVTRTLWVIINHKTFRSRNDDFTLGKRDTSHILLSLQTTLDL